MQVYTTFNKLRPCIVANLMPLRSANSPVALGHHQSMSDDLLYAVELFCISDKTSYF